jgi:hypothetical protein
VLEVTASLEAVVSESAAAAVPEEEVAPVVGEVSDALAADA